MADGDDDAESHRLRRALMTTDSDSNPASQYASYRPSTPVAVSADIAAKPLENIRSHLGNLITARVTMQQP